MALDALTPTRRKVFLVAAILLAVTFTVSAAQFVGARDNVFPAGTPIGGDYVAFDVAAETAARGDAAANYDAEAFHAAVLDLGPQTEKPFRLSWQYPPTYYFAVAPLAALPYAVGYFLWIGVGAALFLVALSRVARDWLTVFVVAASPSFFHATITGQNGFLTGALLIAAAFGASSRPVLAGLAAALLSMKPQLGVLLPIAFAAAGCWRAFGVAAAGTLALGAASLAVYGAGAWVAFAQSLAAVSGQLADGVMPVNKMATPFAAFVYAGLPKEIAGALHAVFAAVAAIGVGLVWRRTPDQPLRAAALLAAVFLTAPYAYFYELILLAPALAVVARRAAADGWLPFEQATLAAAFFLPLFAISPREQPGLSVGFAIALLVAVIVLRRVARYDPALFRRGATAVSGAPA